MKVFLLLFLLTAIWGESAKAEPVAESKPNIIVILGDDIGFGDLGCYGAERVSTPRLDEMAKSGVRFTDFYVASSFCSPSRASLLTGRLSARCGVPYVLFPSEHTGLPPSEITIAEMLKASGYATGCVGKWHLGWRREFRPQQQGFDEFFGMLHTNDTEEWTVGKAFHQLSTFEPMQLRHGDQVVEAPVDQSLITQKYTQRAIEFIRKHRERNFFLYLAHTMPHIPQYVSPKFSGTSKAGLFGDCLQEIDWSTGQILDTLKELQLEDRTLVIFTSDNGAGVRNARANPNSRFPGRDFVGNNGALRGGKGSTLEGGIRVPCIAWWPNQIRAGRVDATPWSTVDFLPSFAQLAGTPVPPVKLDGWDVSQMLFGMTYDKKPRMHFHYFGVQMQAVREDNYKLFVPILGLPEKRIASIWYQHQTGLFERHHRLWPNPTLYDLSEDVSEKLDVTSQHANIAASMLKKAMDFDKEFQIAMPPVQYLPGPIPPIPGQIRSESDNIESWLELTK